MLITRGLTIAFMLLFAALMLNACPGPDEADEGATGATGTQIESPEGVEIAPPEGSGGDGPTSAIGGPGAEGEAEDAGDGEEGTEGATYSVMEAEIMSVSIDSGIVELVVTENGASEQKMFTLADGFPNCPDCGMEMAVQPGDKGEFFFEELPDGTLKFAGKFCANCAEAAKKKSA